MSSERPVEPSGGQDEPPDVLTAVRAVMVLLSDIHDRLAHPDELDDDADLALRLAAMHAAFSRLRHRLESEAP